jgi:hypothetical protein
MRYCPKGNKGPGYSCLWRFCSRHRLCSVRWVKGARSLPVVATNRTAKRLTVRLFLPRGCGALAGRLFPQWDMPTSHSSASSLRSVFGRIEVSVRRSLFVWAPKPSAERSSFSGRKRFRTDAQARSFPESGSSAGTLRCWNFDVSVPVLLARLSSTVFWTRNVSHSGRLPDSR